MSSPNSNAEPLSPVAADGGLATVDAAPAAAAMVALPPTPAAVDLPVQAQSINFVSRHNEVRDQLSDLLTSIPCLKVFKEVTFRRLHMETKRPMSRRLDLVVYDDSSGALHVFEVGCSSNITMDVCTRSKRYEVEVQLLQQMYPKHKVCYRVFVVSDGNGARKIHINSLSHLLVFAMKFNTSLTGTLM